MRTTLAATLVASLALAGGVAEAKPVKRRAAQPVDVRVSADQVVIENGLVERRWQKAPYAALSLRDLRTGRTWSSGGRDFGFEVAGRAIDLSLLSISRVTSRPLGGGGTRLELELTGIPGVTITRVAELRPGIAALRTHTIIDTVAALPVSSAVLEEVGPATPVAPTAHALRAGADWRDATYAGPPVGVGDQHAGTWRATQSAGRWEALSAPAQWLSLDAGEADLAMIAQGTDFPSNRATYDGTRGALRSDFGRDVILLGPLEENGHIENPTDSPGRVRTATPGRPLALDPVILAVGDHDGDVEWQINRTLRALRGRSPQRVLFNSDKIDANKRSTGAKDDMDIDRVRELAPIARELGVETFVLDDGWQARSGDWCPDSPQCPEPRAAYGPRYPDAEFKAVREALGDDLDLGLWWTPLHFHPTAATATEHPEWICQPVGGGLTVYNTVEPASSSNEAGIAQWGPDVLPYIEERLRVAIEEWEVTYFKFDFIAWLDCVGQGDLHDYRDAFVRMLDRLRADYPRVTFTIDETNDYRLFPYASTSRGATWFQNGNPELPQLLHNLWNLSPYVPADALGQNVMPSGDADRAKQPTATWMAAALPSHMSFFTDIRRFPASVRSEIAEWTAFYKAHRARFSGVVYPLLDDPIEKNWTALQTWNPEKGKGALLAFRQTSGDPTRRIALRNVPAGATFRLRAAPTGEELGTVSSADLRSGLTIDIPQAGGASVILVERASSAAARRLTRR